MYRCESTSDCHIHLAWMEGRHQQRTICQDGNPEVLPPTRGVPLFICLKGVLSPNLHTDPWSVELALRSTLKVAHTESHMVRVETRPTPASQPGVPLPCQCSVLRWEKEGRAEGGSGRGELEGGGGGAASGPTFQSPPQHLSLLLPISAHAV